MTKDDDDFVCVDNHIYFVGSTGDVSVHSMYHGCEYYFSIKRSGYSRQYSSSTESKQIAPCTNLPPDYCFREIFIRAASALNGHTSFLEKVQLRDGASDARCIFERDVFLLGYYGVELIRSSDDKIVIVGFDELDRIVKLIEEFKKDPMEYLLTDQAVKHG
jgi:hypothetical protein